MKNGFRVNSIIVGALFILTMIAGMIDASLAAPLLGKNLVDIQNAPDALYVGIFSVLFMALGIVVIATSLFPVVRRQSETIAITYVSFSVIECLLLLAGAGAYLVLLLDSSPLFVNADMADRYAAALPPLLAKMKVDSYQLGMITLGIGSILLNVSFYVSRVIPHWLSIWGIIGYMALLLSAVLALLGIINTTDGMGALLYIPGGLWEFIAFPVWLFLKGFTMEAKQ